MQQLCLSFSLHFLLLSICLILLWLYWQYAKKSRLQEVNLDDNSSFVSWWKIVHFDPQERLEYEGQPVPVSLYYIFMVNYYTCDNTSTYCSVKSVSVTFPHLCRSENFLAIINIFFFTGKCERADHTLQDKPGSCCSGWLRPSVFSFLKLTPNHMLL